MMRGKNRTIDRFKPKYHKQVFTLSKKSNRPWMRIGISIFRRSRIGRILLAGSTADVFDYFRTRHFLVHNNLLCPVVCYDGAKRSGQSTLEKSCWTGSEESHDREFTAHPAKSSSRSYKMKPVRCSHKIWNFRAKRNGRNWLFPETR